MGLLIFYLLLALSVSFLCSVLEAVLLSVPASFVGLKEAEGNRNAARFKKLKTDIDRPLSAILSLNTVAHTVGAAGVGAQATEVFGEAYFGWVSAVLTVLILVLSEIIPKTIGASYWRQLAMSSARVIEAMIWICWPLVWVSERLTRLIAPKEQPSTVSRQEVSAMVTAGVEEGTFEGKENKVIQNLIRLEEIRTREVMTPRIVVATASEQTTVREFFADKELLHYSRIPVWGESHEAITGYVLRQTVMECMAEDRFEVRLAELKRPILAFIDTKPIPAVWEELLAHKEHIALVVDEYGSFEGIVTMEDIIESLLGLEIVDEKDRVTDMQAYARERWAQRRAKYETPGS